MVARVEKDAVVESLERQAVAVEVERRGVDVDRVEIVGKHGNPSAGLDDVLVGFDHSTVGGPVIEAVELLAFEADDNGPSRMVVGWSRDLAAAPLGVKREAIVGVLRQPVKAASLAVTGGWGFDAQTSNNSRNK